MCAGENMIREALWEQKLKGLDDASLVIKPSYANFLRKDMVTLKGSQAPSLYLRTLITSVVRIHALSKEKFPLI
jgi:hypothetical protein